MTVGVDRHGASSVLDVVPRSSLEEKCGCRKTVLFLRSVGMGSVGHEGLLGVKRFLDSSTPHREAFTHLQIKSVVTRFRPTCLGITPRGALLGSWSATDVPDGAASRPCQLWRLGDVDCRCTAVAVARNDRVRATCRTPVKTNHRSVQLIGSFALKGLPCPVLQCSVPGGGSPSPARGSSSS